MTLVPHRGKGPTGGAVAKVVAVVSPGLLTAPEAARVEIVPGDGGHRRGFGPQGCNAAGAFPDDGPSWRFHHLLGLLDGSCDLVGGLHMVHLDVDHSESDSDFVIEVLDGLEVVLGAVGKLEDEVIGVE